MNIHCITHEERVQLLQAHNDLKSLLSTIHECNDLYISDVGKLEGLQFLLKTTMKFVPKKDSDGTPLFYANYVLEELDEGNQND